MTLFAFRTRKGTTKEAKKFHILTNLVKCIAYALKSVWKVWTMGIFSFLDIFEAKRKEKNSFWECMISGFHPYIYSNISSPRAREA